MICDLCQEEILLIEDKSPVRPLIAHRECAFRAVFGGIGHYLNHDFWCIEMGDPDGGLSYRESSLQIWRRAVGDGLFA